MVPGVFSSDQGIVGTRRQDFASAVLRTMPSGDAGLFALSAGMKRENASSVVSTWFEKEFHTGRILMNNNAGTGPTITVDDVSAVIAGQIYMIESTGERVFVTGISGNDLTVVRGFGEFQTPQAADGSGTPVGFQLIGTAYEEGSAKPPSFAQVGYPLWNFHQIQRHAWDYTGTADAVGWHTGDHVAENKKDALFEHSLALERQAWFGTRGYGVKNGQPIRTMAGVLEMVKTNRYSQVTNVDWDDLDTFFQDLYKWNVKGQPNERIFFAGDTVIKVLNKLARLESEIQLIPGATEFGLQVNKWVTPWGPPAMLMRHPLFSLNPVWSKMLVALHPASLIWRYLRDTFVDEYQRDSGIDSSFGVVTTEMSLVMTTEKTAAVYEGIDTAAAST